MLSIRGKQYFGFLLLLPILLVSGKPAISKEADLLNQEGVFDTFKHNLIRYYGVSEEFAELFKVNLKRAITEEIQHQKNLRQGNLDEEDEEDETEAPTTTTEGPGAFGILNGIYGILKGVGTLNPDSAFQSTVNFFPPSQRENAQQLFNSAVGKPVKFTTPTTTKPTSTTPSTTTKDEDYDEDEDETTKAAVATVAVATVATTAAPVVAGSSNLPKYTLRPQSQSQATPAPASSGSLLGTTPQDDELELETNRYIG